ncbi:diguanylate cyclase [Porphyrobacter algicida]|uniref:diguanylate cyclase n=1 Tax=Qipengyuania algicida TaxID=1836209 RepID=A0A845AGU6_9SPHN|nr:GGDEF domain-containing protein [Qipengyuania algicida]MXP29450.1 diguanylate cyclase [Qipengyuania algicida]
MKASAVQRAFDLMVRLRPAHAWTLIVLCTTATALADWLTGADLWFGPVYLLVMCFAAWSLGWRAGHIVGISCLVLTFAINGFDLYPYGGIALAWNLGMRFLALSIVISVIAGARRTYKREWWLARSDALTGAFNRKAFFELASSSIGDQRWRLLIYADLDGLKQTNDTRGHAAGDDCLRAYGSTISKSIRRNDMFARLGGDEFVVFMNVKDEAAARTTASRLHQAMNAIDVEGCPLKCSVGALVVPPGAVAVDELVRRADHLMYEAKLRGACLQLGIASQVEPAVQAGARATPRILNVWSQGDGKVAIERRSNSASHLRI